MSERSVIFLVIIALLGAAFFFPYENTDGYTPGTAAARQSGDDKAKDPALGEVPSPVSAMAAPDPVSFENDPFSPAPAFTGGKGHGGGGWAPALGNVAAARKAEASAITSRLEAHKGGFGERVRLEGTYVCQLLDTPEADPPRITFHQDGTFTDQRFLSARAGVPGKPAAAPTTLPVNAADWAGTYDIHGFTLELTHPDVSGAAARGEYTITPVGDDEDLARPQKLYIEGKILRLAK